MISAALPPAPQLLLASHPTVLYRRLYALLAGGPLRATAVQTALAHISGPPQRLLGPASGEGGGGGELLAVELRRADGQVVWRAEAAELGASVGLLTASELPVGEGLVVAVQLAGGGEVVRLWAVAEGEAPDGPWPTDPAAAAGGSDDADEGGAAPAKPVCALGRPFRPPTAAAADPSAGGGGGDAADALAANGSSSMLAAIRNDEVAPQPAAAEVVAQFELPGPAGAGEASALAFFGRVFGDTDAATALSAAFHSRRGDTAVARTGWEWGSRAGTRRVQYTTVQPAVGEIVVTEEQSAACHRLAEGERVGLVVKSAGSFVGGRLDGNLTVHTQYTVLEVAAGLAVTVTVEIRWSSAARWLLLPILAGPRLTSDVRTSLEQWRALVTAAHSRDGAISIASPAGTEQVESAVEPATVDSAQEDLAAAASLSEPAAEPHAICREGELSGSAESTAEQVATEDMHLLQLDAGWNPAGQDGLVLRIAAARNDSTLLWWRHLRLQPHSQAPASSPNTRAGNAMGVPQRMLADPPVPFVRWLQNQPWFLLLLPPILLLPLAALLTEWLTDAAM